MEILPADEKHIALKDASQQERSLNIYARKNGLIYCAIYHTKLELLPSLLLLSCNYTRWAFLES